jgi:hypothetical protein
MDRTRDHHIVRDGKALHAFAHVEFTLAMRIMIVIMAYEYKGRLFEGHKWEARGERRGYL